MEEIQNAKPKLHLFVCINDRTHIPDNTKPSCGPRITGEMVKEVKQWIRQEGLTTSVYCTKAQCLGFCNSEGGVACIYPQGKFVKGLRSVDDIKDFLTEELKKI